MLYKNLKEYGNNLKKLDVSDWQQIAAFNKIVINYIKLTQLEANAKTEKTRNSH